MEWIDFIIGCCVGAVLGIIFCSVQEVREKIDIDKSVRKEIEQFKAMKEDKG
ncbi:hypothetical protein [Bacillus sp. JUb91]|uniref:hypothetical protein n=1 Tax=Bacillus sp. JUb91 TaxID=2940596 RepID=UPI002168F372|nr:hypothetical protein [Bacillus sp. JUb91]MCS3600129.1 uncharacterized membrane-anchored protein YhcB (DUF1043 family) [Bacillus sp. JUb91]